MYIYLDRMSLVRLYCLCRQAARSLHRGHAASWDGLRAYYDERRKGHVAKTASAMDDLLPAHVRDHRPLDGNTIGRQLPEVGFLEYVFGGWRARMKSRWAVRDDEIQHIADRLRAFLRIVEEPEKPVPERLIELRMDLTGCEYILERRGFGLPDFKRAGFIEHYDQSDGVPRVTIEDVLGRSERPVATPTRASA